MEVSVLRICELKRKEVINICSCNRLGFVSDVEFETCRGEIKAIIIPGPGKFLGLFGSEKEYVIPYRCIKQIGDDVILVEINEDELLKGV